MEVQELITIISVIIAETPVKSFTNQLLCASCKPVYIYFLLSSKGRNADLDESEDRCWIYDACSNQWKQSDGNLTEKRKNAVGKVLPYLLQGTERPWILGGKGNSNVSLSTEYYTGTKWVKSENNILQEEKFGACAAKINSTIQKINKEVLVLIGGKTTYREVESFIGDYGPKKELIQLNMENITRINKNNVDWSWLNHGRYLHFCETFPMTVASEDGNTYIQEAIIVAGSSTVPVRL